MSEQLGLKIGQWFYRKGKITEDQIDMIRYAFEILCSEFTEILCIIVYSILTKQIIQTLVFLMFFRILRHCFEGYHAKTISRCLILTIGVYLISMMIYQILPVTVLGCFFVVGILLKIDYCCRNRQVKSVILSILLHSVIIVITYFLQDIQYLRLLVVVEFIVSISLIPERRGTNEGSND